MYRLGSQWGYGTLDAGPGCKEAAKAETDPDEMKESLTCTVQGDLTEFATILGEAPPALVHLLERSAVEVEAAMAVDDEVAT